MNQLVSVIIPTYNARDTIIKCLESVHRQTYSNIETIVIDDGSSDDTFALLKEYMSKHKDMQLNVFQIRNSGPAYARNMGIKRASGEYIAFLDSDDKWETTKIEKQMTCLKQYPEIKLLGCGHSIGDRSFFYDTGIRHISKYRLLFKNYFLTSCVILKREVLNNIKFIESRKYSEDYFLWLQIAFHDHKCAFLKETLTILCDKPVYGGKGLSANLWNMEKGELNNLAILYREHRISVFWYWGASLFSILKYYKRLIITILR